MYIMRRSYQKQSLQNDAILLIVKTLEIWSKPKKFVEYFVLTEIVSQ